MNKFITLSTSTAALSGLLLITGCGGGGGGGGPAVPANAATIDATNAFALVQKASTAAQAISEATENNIVTADGYCADSGSSTSTVVINEAVTSESASGQVTLNDCGVFVSGVGVTYFIDATLNYSASETINVAALTATFVEKISGNAISLITSDDSVTVNGYALSVNGSESFSSFSGTYSATVQLSYDSLTLGEGFAAQATTPLTGSTGYYDCPTGGVLLITGATGTQARGTFSNSIEPSVTIEYHTGDNVWIEDPVKYNCSDFES